MYNYRTSPPPSPPLSSSSLPSRPILLIPPRKHASNQYGPNQRREGMQSTLRSAPAGRKEPFVTAPSVFYISGAPLVFFFLLLLFFSSQLFCFFLHKRSQATTATASPLSHLSMHIFRDGGAEEMGGGFSTLEENDSSRSLLLYKAIFHHLHSMCKQHANIKIKNGVTKKKKKIQTTYF